MKRLHILGFICVCLGIAAMLLFRVNTRAIAARPSSCGAWNVVPSPNIPGKRFSNGFGASNVLSGVVTISANDIWAVGTAEPFFPGSQQPLTEHWNGTAWSIVPNSSLLRGGELNGVTAVSSSDVWAVGFAPAAGNSIQTLIEHWDGTGWSIVPSPSPGPQQNNLYAVSAVSATDIWAVGSYILNYTTQQLLEHWNGTQWSAVSGPTNTGPLNSVTAISTNNVWAVGMIGGGPSTSLIEHWDGSQWSIVQHPNPSYNRVEFYGVSASSATDIWAIGLYSNHSIHVGIALFEHWNGKKWSIVSPPTSQQVTLYAVTAISPTDVWAVGNFFYGKFTTLTEHWDGTSWSIVAGPNSGDIGNSLNAVASVPGSNSVWAVGDATYITPTYGYLTNTLTAYYC